jgi:DNA-binding NarL/FixJ family response regulator
VIDEAKDGVEAVEKASRLRPDIIVLDVAMPKMNGLDACRRIRKTAPASEVLFLTQHDSPQMMREAKAAGGRGYVAKSSAARDLFPAVEALSRHKSFTGRHHHPPCAG